MSAYNTFKDQIHEILERADEKGSVSFYVDIFIITLIILNVAAVILSTVGWIEQAYGIYLEYFELFSVAVFSIEYAGRVWSVTSDSRYAGIISGRFRYMISPLALIDLFAILPFYLPMFFAVDLRFIRALRLMRLLRLLKLGRYSESVRTLGRVIENKKEQLISTLIALLIMLTVASSLMYYAEHQAQPDQFSSIPAAMWWGIATLTTVGYGDIYPVTTLGKMLGTVVALLGIGIFALPAGIIASGFESEIKHSAENRSRCPNCGYELGE
ncbi:MAG: ion transporter [Balneolaceae bacterium]|nr:ion transporter [Balneolaceae bacterium]